MGIGIWHKFALGGNTATSLDGISIAELANYDVCHVYDTDMFYYCVFIATATDADSPTRKRPYDFATYGAGVWYVAGSPYGNLQVQPSIVAGLPINGGITGGDISRASNTTLTITPITCLDSGLTTQLYTSANATPTIPHTGSIAANTIYHIFLVKLVADGSFEFRSYTTEAAVASDAQVSKYRWIGAWLTNGSSQLVQGLQIGDLFIFGKASEAVITGSLTTSYATYSHSSVLPTTRIREIEYGVTGTDGDVTSSLDGTNVEAYIGYAYSGTDTGVNAWGASSAMHSGMLPFLATRQFKSTAGGSDLLCHKVRFKR